VLASCLQCVGTSCQTPFKSSPGALSKTDGTTPAKSFVFPKSPCNGMLSTSYHSPVEGSYSTFMKRLTLLVKMCMQAFLFYGTSPLHIRNRRGEGREGRRWRWRQMSSTTRSSLSQTGAGCFLKLDFTTPGPPEEQPRGRQVRPRINGRCNPHCGVPGKILEKDVRGG